MVDGQSVLVIGEINQGHLSATTAEVLAAGHTLAQQLQAELAVALAGDTLSTVIDEAFHAGAQRVFSAEDALLGTPQVDLHLAALIEICRTVAPKVILCGRTAWGRDLTPRLACRLGVGLLQDCLQVEVDATSGYMLATRPVYGGNVLAKVRCTASPQIAALRPKAYTPLPTDTSRRGEVVAVPVTLDATMARVTVLRQERDETPGVKLEEARVVVAGGRGLGGPEPFRELQEMAGMLNAAVGASRAAVDAGWVPGTWQVGLTGKTITPELYITIGISGASQHMAGCSGAKVIVAINKDAEANIFRDARYGVIGDWQTVLPAFMEALRQL